MAQPPKASGLREESYGFLIQSLARHVEGTMKEKLLTVGIDFKLFANLMTLYTVEGINQRQLGKMLNLPEYNMSRRIDALVKEGWAERRQDPDSRRTFLVYLTEKGREKASQLPKLIHEANDEHLTDLSETERTELIRLLQKTLSTATLE